MSKRTQGHRISQERNPNGFDKSLSGVGACPECGALEDEPCKTPQGRPKLTMHVARPFGRKLPPFMRGLHERPEKTSR
jgi:hypothetical protein